MLHGLSSESISSAGRDLGFAPLIRFRLPLSAPAGYLKGNLDDVRRNDREGWNTSPEREKAERALFGHLSRLLERFVIRMTRRSRRFRCIYDPTTSIFLHLRCISRFPSFPLHRAHHRLVFVRSFARSSLLPRKKSRERERASEFRSRRILRRD